MKAAYERAFKLLVLVSASFTRLCTCIIIPKAQAQDIARIVNEVAFADLTFSQKTLGTDDK